MVISAGWFIGYIGGLCGGIIDRGSPGSPGKWWAKGEIFGRGYEGMFGRG